MLPLLRPPDCNRVHALRVFVNPYGGHGRGIETYQTAKRVLDAAGIRQSFTITDHAGAIFEGLASEDLAGFDGVVIVGGDGSYSEAVRGMMSRADGVRLPLGIIPSGTTTRLRARRTHRIVARVCRSPMAAQRSITSSQLSCNRNHNHYCNCISNCNRNRRPQATHPQNTFPRSRNTNTKHNHRYKAQS